MSTFDELTRRQDVPVAFCVEIDLGSEVLYYADTLVREAETKWDDRVRSLSEITRSADPESRMFEIPAVQLTLNNDGGSASDEGWFDALLVTHNDFVDATVTIYVAQLDPGDNVVKRQAVFTGVPWLRSVNAREVHFELWPFVWKKVGLIQRTVNLLDFPNAKAGDVGAGGNIVLAFGATPGVNGSMRCPVVVDTGSGTRRLMFTQHFTYAVGSIWRERSGQKATVTPSSTGSDTDGSGNRYMFAEISSSDYAVDDTWWADPVPMTSYPSGGLTTWKNPVTAVEQMLLAFTDVVSGDLDGSWSTAVTEYDGRSGYGTWEWGYLLPTQPFEIDAEGRQDKGWGLVAEMLSGAGYTAYMKADGTIALALLHPWDAPAATAHYSEKRGDFASDPQTERHPFGILNKADLFYAGAQAEQNEASRHFENATSQSTLGTFKGNMRSVGVRGQNLADDVGTWEMWLKSGAYRLVTWECPGLLGLQDGSDIGEVVTLTHRRCYGNQEELEVLVIEVTIDPARRVTRLAGITCGDPLGTVVVS